MKRRREHSQPDSPVPIELRVFRPELWGRTPLEAAYAWGAARREYSEQHPDAWPHGLALIAGNQNAKDKAHGLRPRFPEYDEGSL